MGYYFVIDTDEYAGNFERELCAFITGITGECGRGHEIVEKIKDQLDIDMFNNIVGQKPDDNNCWRPVTIYTTPDYYNNGFGFIYKKGEEKLAKRNYKKNCIEEAKNASGAEEKKEWLLDAKKCEIGKSLTYNSIAIVLDRRPDNKIIKIMKKRAEELALASRNNITVKLCGLEINKFTISGFRLITKTVVTRERKL